VAAIVLIAVVALLVISFLPARSFVGNAGASAPAASTNPASASAPAKMVKHSVTSHGGKGPHPGTLEIWLATGGGPSTVDPGQCYYTVCADPITNVYESLIAFNGTLTGPTADQFVPQVATCVPGSNLCLSQFGGNDLIYPNLTTGAPQYYTFEIDQNAHFYDPVTNVGWPVYPSDVVFTFARTMGWSDLPFEQATNGWINTQDLVPKGNSTWDGGLHAPLNNTPGNILGAFIINDTNYCPTSPTILTNGCVTFNVGGSGLAWPYFLQLVADELGGGIVPCGAFTALGATVPGFLGTNASGGDGPCLLPGNTTSTTAPGYAAYIAATGPTGWDTFEKEALNLPNAIQPAVQWTMIGSGPYYVTNPVNPAQGYTLTANPDYKAPVGCAGQPGCLPAAGAYAHAVDVVWESGSAGDTTGLNEMAAGQADSAGFFSSDTATVLGFTSYKLITGVPSLTIFFDPIDLNFSVAAEATQDSSGQLNVPGDFLQNVALRQFLVNAYPYTTIDQTISCVIAGTVCFGAPYGGAIPHNMGNYYPTNVSWPTGNPISNPTQTGNVTWWWTQATTVGSQWYDPQLSGCNAGTPCRWATFSITGNTALDTTFNDWNQQVFNLTGGALSPYLVDISGSVAIGDLGSTPGNNPLPVYSFGWAPDYPDPTDYVTPVWYPDNSYTAPDAVHETLATSTNNASSCTSTYGTWATLVLYANMGQVPTNCQGAAYDTMVAWMNLAAHEPNIVYRTLEYNLIEHIGNELALYVYDPQQLSAVDYGNWIQGSTINLNPLYGGGGVNIWSFWGYASDYFNTTFTESNLTAGTSWSVTLGGQTLTSTTATITFTALVNGSYPYTVSAVAGFLANPSSGTVTVAGADVPVAIGFSPITGPQYTLSFTETGLRANTAWSVDVTSATSGGQVLNGNTTTLSTILGAGMYGYTPGAVVGYTLPAAGTVNLTANETVNVSYAGQSFSKFPVSFTETGLPSTGTWSVAINGTTIAPGSGTLTVSLANGSYSWGVATLPTGYAASPSGGVVSVAGAPRSVAVTITATGNGGGGGTTNNVPWNSLSTLAWILIGVLALLVVIFLALAIMAGRRPPSSPPESWSSSSTTTSTDGGTTTTNTKGGNP